jgi:hypothetical protein
MPVDDFANTVHWLQYTSGGLCMNDYNQLCPSSTQRDKADLGQWPLAMHIPAWLHPLYSGQPCQQPVRQSTH